MSLAFLPISTTEPCGSTGVCLRTTAHCRVTSPSTDWFRRTSRSSRPSGKQEPVGSYEAIQEDVAEELRELYGPNAYITILST
jgi:hypothetical protein